MEMVDRYIYAVTQKLPQSQRKDIADELRSLIEDMLEDRAGKGNFADKDVEDVLLELGSPKELADKYRSNQKYLIGPELFDSYLYVLKVVMAVVAISIGIGFVIQVVLNPVNILDHFIKMIVSAVTALPTAFGWTTFGFAMGELMGNLKKEDLQWGDEDWKPTNLPPIPAEHSQIKRRDAVTSIVFYAFLIILFTFSSDYLGIWIFHDEFNGVVPFLNEQNYGTYLVFIILILSIGILNECLKLAFGKWSYKLVLYTTLSNTISMFVILFMVTRDGFWNPTFMNELVKARLINVGSDAYHTVDWVWNQAPSWIIIILIINIVWNGIDGFIKARKNKK
ncbi:HAAS signaling domain-containing protein [Oceanobacillus kapialis]|uniref:HAAS signaling domain-containing protein n=1 Tax=Oceanobacillus kapialis TaxID=481353 RepID=UPI00384B23C0